MIMFNAHLKEFPNILNPKLTERVFTCLPVYKPKVCIMMWSEFTSSFKKKQFQTKKKYQITNNDILTPREIVLLFSFRETNTYAPTLSCLP